MSTATRLQENPGASECQEVPVASIYQSDLRGSQVHLCNVARLPRDARFIRNFGMEFKSNYTKKRHI